VQVEHDPVVTAFGDGVADDAGDVLEGGIIDRALVAIGVDPTRTLVLSQVVLSFGIPFALIPLVRFTARSDVMGTLVNRVATTVAASAIAALIVALNVFLLWQTFFG